MSERDELLDMKFYTVAEIAAVGRVSKMTIYREIHAGVLPATRVGRRGFRVLGSALKAYLGKPN